MRSSLTSSASSKAGISTEQQAVNVFVFCLSPGSGRSVIFVLQEERERGQLCIKEDSVSKL